MLSSSKAANGIHLTKNASTQTRPNKRLKNNTRPNDHNQLKVLQITGRISGNKWFIPTSFFVRGTPYRRFVLLRIAQTGVIAQECALFFRTKLFHSISAQVSVTSHTSASPHPCAINLRTKTFKKTTAQCAKTPMITVIHQGRTGCFLRWLAPLCLQVCSSSAKKWALNDVEDWLLGCPPTANSSREKVVPPNPNSRRRANDRRQWYDASLSLRDATAGVL